MTIVIVLIIAASLAALLYNPVLGLVMLAFAIGLVIEHVQYNNGKRDM